MIIITTYHSRENDSRFTNRRTYLEQTIASINNYESSGIFHLIIDDGSTDSACDDLRETYANSTNRRVVRRDKAAGEILSSTNARNFALNLCLEEKTIDGVDISAHTHITFIDSDDVIINIEERINYLTNKGCDFLYTDALLFFDDQEAAFRWEGLRKECSYTKFWIYGKMPYPTMTWSVKFLRELKKWNNATYNFNAFFDPIIGCGEDVDIALSSFECAAARGFVVGYLPVISAGYRIHDNSLSVIRNQSLRHREENSVLVRHFGYYYSKYMYFRRFLVRPECYIHVLISVKNLFKEKLSKKDFLK